MFLVVGLGNPGSSYEKTRHNVGFWAIDALSARHRYADWKEKYGALWARGTMGKEDVVLCKPQTYMNRSGEPAQALANFFKIETERIIVVHDELDFLPGLVRLKKGGGAGGHNGLRSLISTVGEGFVRIRMGVGKPASSEEGANFVLAVPPKAERELLVTATDVAADAVEKVTELGVTQAMNLLNRK